MEIASGYTALLGEGAIWNHKTGELYWVDIEARALLVERPGKGAPRVITFKQQIGTVVPADDGDVLVALEDGVYKLNPATESLLPVASNPAPRETRFNDGKCDPAGRFWVGTMERTHRKPLGALYRIDADYSLHTMLEQVTISNGIAWSPDKSRMYYIDTRTGKVVEYAYDAAAGTISAPRTAVTIPPGMGRPDGCTIDEEGMLWIALWGGGAVSRWNPADGKLLLQLAVPAWNASSVAFGGAGLSTLYITTAASGMSREQAAAYPRAGALFKVKPGVKGLPACFFKTGGSPG